MDIWRSGFVRATLAEVVAAQDLGPFEIEWLPAGDKRFTFLADPFGLVRDDRTYVFVEAFDYRDRRGRIEVLTYDERMVQVDRSTCLAEDWHLSYPVTFEADGDVYMLPEAHRSGGLTLYRASDFPHRWERVRRLDLPHVAVDATPLFHVGLWWLFYAAAGDPVDQLHIAFAETLSGPWRQHPASPITNGLGGSRPGGRAVQLGERILLPVQDCSRTYGGAVRALWFDQLTPERIDVALEETITAPQEMAPFSDGLHTLSACGSITLFDVKRIDRSLAGQAAGLLGKVRRSARKWRRPSPGSGAG